VALAVATLPGSWLEAANPPIALQWDWTGGGGSGALNEGRAIKIDAAGNTYVTYRWTGGNPSRINCDTRKVNPIGTVMWLEEYEFDCMDNALDSAENLIVVGTSGLPPADFAVVKETAANVNVFNNTYGVVGVHEVALAVTTDGPGSIYFSGYTDDLVGDQDAVVVKLAPDGTHVWTYTYDQPGRPVLLDVIVDAQGIVYAVGRTDDLTSSSAEVLIVKLAANGTPIGVWDTSDAGLADGAVAMTFDSVGGFCFTGFLEGSTPNPNLIATWCFEAGGSTWRALRSYAGAPEGGVDIAVDANENVYVVAGTDEITVMKYDTAGNFLWDATWPGVPGALASAVGIDLDPQGKPVIIGNRQDDGARVVTLGYTTAGVELWSEVYVISHAGGGEANAMATDAQGYPAFTGGVGPTSGTVAGKFGQVLDLWEPDSSWYKAPIWENPLGPWVRDFLTDTEDWASVHFREGQTYQITADAIGASLDATNLALFDPQGESLAVSLSLPGGDGAGSTVTGLVWTATEAGTYHVATSPSDDLFGANREYQFEISGDNGASHLWWVTLGGPDAEVANDVVQLSDGSFLATGESTSFLDGAGDALIAHFDEDAGLMWSETIGGSLGRDTGRAVLESASGTLLVAIDTDHLTAATDIVLAELDASSGAPVRQTVYDTGNDDAVTDMVRLTDDSILMGGSTEFPDGVPKILLLRVEDDGTLMWAREIGNPSFAASSALGVFEGGTTLFVSGYVGDDALLLSLDLDGTLLWGKTYGASGFRSRAQAVMETGDGGLILAGTVEDLSGPDPPDAWIARLDAVGTVVWQQTYGGSGTDEARELVASSDGGFLFAGSTNSFGGTVDSDGWMVKLDTFGAIVWQNAYGMAANDAFRAVARNHDGGFAAAGYAEVTDQAIEMLVIKTDAAGLLDPACAWVNSTAATAQTAALTASTFSATVLTTLPSILADSLPDSRVEATRAIVCDYDEPAEVSPPGSRVPLRWISGDTFVWQGATPDVDSFNIYRGACSDMAGADYGELFEAGNTTASAIDSDHPPPPCDLLTYVVSAVNDLGEGTIGARSDGLLRILPSNSIGPP
jgi:hypothetical protein